MSHYTSTPKKDLTPAEREETMRRSQELRRRIEQDQNHRPMNPDRDLSWEHTNFKDFDND